GETFEVVNHSHPGERFPHRERRCDRERTKTPEHEQRDTRRRTDAYPREHQSVRPLERPLWSTASLRDRPYWPDRLLGDGPIEGWQTHTVHGGLLRGRCKSRYGLKRYRTVLRPTHSLFACLPTSRATY